MGLFDGVLGGIVGAEMISVVNGVIARHRGLNGMVEQFQQQGAGNAIRSWISTGPNLPISPEQVHQAVGPDAMAELAAKFGMTPQELAAKLATILPEAVDKMTPTGVVPTGQ